MWSKVEDFTLPHMIRRTPADSGRFCGTPADSGGLQRTHILDCVGVTWANLGFLVQVESAGVRRSPPESVESARLRQTQPGLSPVESTGLSPVESTGVQCSSGLRRTPAGLNR